MKVYNERFKLKIVQRYLAGEASFRTLANEHGVGRTVMRGWVSGYQEHGTDALRSKRGQCSVEFKLSVLRRMKQESLALTQVLALFDLRGGTGVVAIKLRRKSARRPRVEA